MISFRSHDPKEDFAKEMEKIRKEAAIKSRILELSKSIKENKDEASKEEHWKDVTPKVPRIPESSDEPEVWEKPKLEKIPKVIDSEGQWETIGDKMKTIIKAKKAREASIKEHWKDVGKKLDTTIPGVSDDDDYASVEGLETGVVYSKVPGTKKEYFSEEERMKPKQGIRKARKGDPRVPGLVKWAGKVGFEGAKEALEGKPGIKDPEKLAGWLKGQAKKRGQLSPQHPYVGRKKKRKKSYSLVIKSPNKAIIDRIAKTIKIEVGKEYIDRSYNAASKAKIEAGYPQGISKLTSMPIKKAKDYLDRPEVSKKKEIERGYPQGISKLRGMPIKKVLKQIKKAMSKAKKVLKSKKSLKLFESYLKSKYFKVKPTKSVLNMIKAYKAAKKALGVGSGGAGLVAPAMGTANIPKKKPKKVKVATGKFAPIKKTIKVETGKEYIDRGANASSKAKIEAGYPQGQSKGMPRNSAGRKANDYINRPEVSIKDKIEEGYPQGIAKPTVRKMEVVQPKK